MWKAGGQAPGLPASAEPQPGPTWHRCLGAAGLQGTRVDQRRPKCFNFARIAGAFLRPWAERGREGAPTLNEIEFLAPAPEVGLGVRMNLT